MQNLTDLELREKTTEFRKRLESGSSLDDLLIEAFAVWSFLILNLQF